jgi:uncharacterized protein (TIGR04255 family)
MNHENQPIPSPPIIEAVVDIDCDLPPNLDLQGLREAAGDVLRDRYPKCREQLIQEHLFTKEGDAPPEFRVSQGLGALQFVSEDEKQLIQFRPNGFSFNRLAPYGSLDEYLPEIEEGWRLFRSLAKPVVIRKVGIRMINRIFLPITDGNLRFGDYLANSPRLPAVQGELGFLGFFEQHMVVDNTTGDRANIVRTTETIADNRMPMILDIDVFRVCEGDPADWNEINLALASLRDLKNRIFNHTLTPQCLNLFSP